MKNLLKQLYRGEINPGEKIAVQTPAYQSLNRKINNEKMYFQSVLSASDAKRFDALSDMELKRSCADAFENFVYGFRLGAQLIAEAIDAPPLPGEE